MPKVDSKQPQAVEANTSTKKRKLRELTGPVGPRTKPEKPSAHAKSSDTLKSGTNLTKGDWLVVLNWHHERGNSQDLTVTHFRELGWKVSQPSLSRNLRSEAELRRQLAAVPNAANAKRDRVVTQPQVDQALFTWQKEMEARGEAVTGPMLMGKCTIFEEKLAVPEEERLPGRGWLGSFKKA